MSVEFNCKELFSFFLCPVFNLPMDGHTSVRRAGNRWTAPYTFVHTFFLRWILQVQKAG